MTWIVLGGVWVSAAYSLAVDDSMRAAIQVSLAAGVTIGWVAAKVWALASAPPAVQEQTDGGRE